MAFLRLWNPFEPNTPFNRLTISAYLSRLRRIIGSLPSTIGKKLECSLLVVLTSLLEYFVRTTLEAQLEAEGQIDFTLRKARFFDRYKDRLNERQHRVIQRMMDEGPDGFIGGMNARKYMTIEKTSKATATRDMQHLFEVGAFVFAGTGGGRSTSYNLDI